MKRLFWKCSAPLSGEGRPNQIQGNQLTARSLLAPLVVMSRRSTQIFDVLRSGK
jgi:hypothetical protein